MSERQGDSVAIGQIAMTVRQVDTALAFYRDILGLPVSLRPGPNLAFLDAAGVRLMLTTPQGAGMVGSNSILYFKVGGVEQAYRDMLANGVAGERAPQMSARMPDHELWIGFVRDPDGNLVGLMEERPLSGR